MPEIFKAEKPKEKVSSIDEMLVAASNNQWSSFVACPKHLKFEMQHDDENVIILGRAHFIVNLGWITVLSFAIFVPMFWGEFPFFKVLNATTMMEVSILWYMALAFYGIQSFLLWFYNVYIVTNERLVDVDFLGLLSKTINVTQLSKIEDVNYSQRGLLQSMLNFGDVIVQTASEQRTPDREAEISAFTFASISNPDKVASVISQLIEDEEDSNRQH
jgi:hypothetical protein